MASKQRIDHTIGQTTHIRYEWVDIYGDVIIAETMTFVATIDEHKTGRHTDSPDEITQTLDVDDPVITIEAFQIPDDGAKYTYVLTASIGDDLTILESGTLSAEAPE